MVDKSVQVADVLVGWLASAFSDGSDSFSGSETFDFLGFNQVFNDEESWSSSGFRDGVEVYFPSNSLFTFLLSGVEFLGKLVHFFVRHDAKEGGQGNVFGKSTVLFEVLWVLERLSNLSSEFFRSLDSVKVLGVFDRLSFVTNEVGEKSVLWWVVEFYFFLVVSFFGGWRAVGVGARARAGART